MVVSKRFMAATGGFATGRGGALERMTAENFRAVNVVAEERVIR
jgi:hypothetical protein